MCKACLQITKIKSKKCIFGESLNYFRYFEKIKIFLISNLFIKPYSLLKHNQKQKNVGKINMLNTIIKQVVWLFRSIQNMFMSV